MQQLSEAVNSALDTMITGGVIETLIADRLEKTIASVVDDAFKNYSDFGKSLTKAITENLQVDFKKLDLATYHDFILKYVQRQLDASLLAKAEIEIGANLKGMLDSVPAEVKISDLVAGFIEFVSEHRRFERDDSDQITLIIEESSYGFRHIFLDIQANQDRYRCKYQLDCDKEGRVYSVKIDDVDPQKTMFIGPLYSFERQLFQLYVAKSALIFDKAADDIDLYLPERECEC